MEEKKIVIIGGKGAASELADALERQRLKNSHKIVIIDDMGTTNFSNVKIGEDEYEKRENVKKQNALKIPPSILYTYGLHLAASGYKMPVKSNTIINFEKLINEFKLIQDKKSLLSRNQREETIALFNKNYKKI